MQPIATFPVSEVLKRKLHDAGFYYLEDLSVEHCRTHSWIKDALIILKFSTPKIEFKSALDQWQIESSSPSIVTFCQSLDAALGCNGVKLASITEFCGLAGTGKTQICLQLCADVTIPATLGGLQGESIFIDTNTNFSTHRLEEIVSACVIKCEKLLSNIQSESLAEYSKSSVLKSIHYIQAVGSARFAAVVHNLTDFIQEHPRLKLIVIDSIVFPFKDGCPEFQRTGILYRMMASLQKIATEKMIAIVLTNEMTTRVGLSGEQVVAGLGDAWSHRCNFRVLLSKPAHAASGERCAIIFKSPLSTQTCVQFQITNEGIRDLR